MRQTFEFMVDMHVELHDLDCGRLMNDECMAGLTYYPFLVLFFENHAPITYSMSIQVVAYMCRNDDDIYRRSPHTVK